VLPAVEPSVAAPSPPPAAAPAAPRRRGRLARWVAFIALAAAAALWLLVHRVERDGLVFYELGRVTVASLDELAAALARGDAVAAGAFLPADYSGETLGLLALEPVDAGPGIAAARFAPDRRATDRETALAEWRAYLASFAEIEELRLHLLRLDRWEGDGDLLAGVRFEAIGRPHGASRSVIDRATFAMSFVPREQGGIAIRGLHLETGERVGSERPQFTEVGAAAGIAFVNRAYPGFLDRPLRFGMIRYGPGGISAVDVDRDGFHDLFVPDGVASRLLRNRGDGTFEDVTEAAGLAGLDGVSVGVFADWDNDGWRDLFVSRTFRPNQLFHNEGPDAAGRVTFRDVTAGSGLGEDCCTTVASWADYDNDGLLDLYLGRYIDPRRDIPTTFYARNGEPNRLYRNLGGGRFADVTIEAGVGDTGLCLGTAFGDLDDDGWPDLWVTNDFGRKTLYRNDGPTAAGGPPTFSDVTRDAGALAYGAGMSATIGDYDNDARLDLYVTHIRSEHAWFAAAPMLRRYMWTSLRQGTWRTDMPLYWEMARDSGTDFVAMFRQMAAGNNLLRNRGDGTFEDTTVAAGANPPGWFWGAVLADLDNDGWQDLYAADGWVYGARGTEIELEFLHDVAFRQAEYKTGALFDPARFGGRSWHGWERNRHLRSNGPDAAGRVSFREVGRATGTDLLLNSRGVAAADFWNRGRVDLAVAASEAPHALLRNDGVAVATGVAEPGWLQVELVGTRSNRDAVGARVTAEVGSLQLVREVTAGDGYASQSMARLHFGLGAAGAVDRLTVRWPRTGEVQSFSDVRGGRIVEVTEGQPELVEKRWGPAPAW
jgi:hypothetical protein